jgi:hypothetical protein
MLLQVQVLYVQANTNTTGHNENTKDLAVFRKQLKLLRLYVTADMGNKKPHKTSVKSRSYISA